MSRLRPSFPFFFLAPTASTGVAGPASSTDNAVVRWDGTTGLTLQNSVVTIADTTGNMAGVGTLASGAITSTGASSMGSLTLTTDLAVADGGTGLSSGTSGGILGYTATGTLASSALLTLNGIVLGGGAGATPTSSAAMTSGQVLIGSTGVAPVLALIGGGENITVTSGAGSISVAVTGTISLTRGGTNAALTANVGGVVYSTATALAILAGTATAGQHLQSGASAAPSWTTATYPATAGATAGMFLRSDATNFVNSVLVLPNAAAISTILFASAADTISALATANSAVLVTSSTGVPSLLGSMTSGQLVIGSTGATPVLATLTAGAPITVVNAAGSITIDVTAASATAEGVVELATVAETNTGTDAVRAVTPASISGATRTIILMSAGGWPPTTAGASAVTKVESVTNLQNIQVMDFDAATRENAQWTIKMPDSYDGGTVTASFVWLSTGTANDVIWGVEGRAYGDAETLDQAWGTAITVTDTQTATANQVLISAATTAVTFAGTPAGGEMVQIRVFRDAAAAGDTLTVDARLIAVRLEYQINQYSD